MLHHHPSHLRHRPRVALVGNAPLHRNFTDMIDCCEVVVRCNEAKNWGPHSGTKTDVLCISQTDAPARRFISEQSILRQPRFPDVKELWFFRQERSLVDPIIEANNLQNIPIRWMAPDLFHAIQSDLQRRSQYDFSGPSTGFLAFQYILNAPEYKDYDKWLFGFNFQVWLGHPGHAEAQIVRELCTARKDILFHASPNRLGWLRQTYFELKYRLQGRLRVNPHRSPLRPDDRLSTN